ncbi:hypothetical protein PHMEG_00021928, partial [Phytophthora megakarya]
RGVTGKSAFGNVRWCIFTRRQKYVLTQVAQGRNKRLREGKEPFSFSMYRAVAKAMLLSTKKRNAFGHAFLLVCWNLMCRATSVESIQPDHLSWCEDSVTITFAHMKNDQDGSRPRTYTPTQCLQKSVLSQLWEFTSPFWF